MDTSWIIIVIRQTTEYRVAHLCTLRRPLSSSAGCTGTGRPPNKTTWIKDDSTVALGWRHSSGVRRGEITTTKGGRRAARRQPTNLLGIRDQKHHQSIRQLCRKCKFQGKSPYLLSFGSIESSEILHYEHHRTVG